MIYPLPCAIHYWKNSYPKKRIPNPREERVKAIAALFTMLAAHASMQPEHVTPAVVQLIVNACVPKSWHDPKALEKWKGNVADDVYHAILLAWPLNLFTVIEAENEWEAKKT